MVEIFPFIFIGFIAQLIDGSIGMGYKVSSTTLLLTLGVPPLYASSSVHTAGVIVSAISGLSHIGYGNVDRGILKQLVIPGILGGIAGALLLTVISTQVIKPLVALYLLLMGLRIIRKSLGRVMSSGIKSRFLPLAIAGGFFDAIGGGGWGPIVTGTLVVDGHDPRYVIGSVNMAEFFVSLAQTIAFLVVLRDFHGAAIIGLVVGGAASAPLAAYITRHLPIRRLMLVVGVVIVILSIRTFLLSFV